MCSMQCLEVKDMARHHNAEGKQRNNINKRVSTLEREVKELTRKTPIEPAQAMNMAVARKAGPSERPDFYRMAKGNANYSDVRDDIKRLGGRSTNRLTPDDQRGAKSPLEEHRRRK
jgi:hypothetical protein